ncbi:MAG: NAD(P)/FAD-dependent oxidoreductase [Bacillota bacterium]
MHTVIIGNGIAGNAVAFNIRKYDRQGKVTVISAEDCQAYDPGALPYYVSSEVPRKVVFIKAAEDYRRENIELLLGKKVVAIHPDYKAISLEGGGEMTYDNLVIATGGDSVIPPFPGAGKEGIFGCKSLFEADRLAEHNGKSAVVIGSGLIGIEVGEALKKRGYEVYLVELLEWIMPRVFDREPAELLAASLSRNGINVLTGEKVLAIQGGSRVQGVTTDKRTINCDTVVLAAGVAPASRLAVNAGLEIGKTRGIKVDQGMMTSEPGIYACGDCVESRDAFTGHSALYQLRHNALEQGEVIAKICCGIEASYRGAWSFTRVHFFGAYGVSLGQTYASVQEKEGVEIIEKSKPEGYSRLIVQNGMLMGAQLVGKAAHHAGYLLGALWRRDNLSRLKDNREKLVSLNSPYPWNYRLLGQYINF